jgi:ketosteroid isomerase-like protein
MSALQKIRSERIARPAPQPKRFAPAAAAVIAAVAVAYAVFGQRIVPPGLVLFGDSDRRAGTVRSAQPPDLAKADLRLSREAIESLLEALDQARRRKDAEGILRHIAPDAVITIHIRQGSQQQMTTLSRDEYRTTLNMGFAFPSANDYARISTHIALAPDQRSAKVSLKSTETLQHAHRQLKVEGEETLVFRMRGDTPTIVSLEHVMPGDST